MQTKEPAIVLMSKAPFPGKSKTRLQSHLPPDMCARLQEAFIKDIAGVLKQLPYQSFVSYSPVESERYFKEEIPVSGGYFPQPEGNLGERMLYSVREVWRRGFRPVLVIGSDIPSLQPCVLEQALVLLKKSDVCLGPTFDGGYYLIGMHKPVPELFQQIPWSTKAVLTATLERIREQGLRVTFLERLNDIDVWDDVVQLYQKLDSLPVYPRHTAEILKLIGLVKNTNDPPSGE